MAVEGFMANNPQSQQVMNEERIEQESIRRKKLGISKQVNRRFPLPEPNRWTFSKDGRIYIPQPEDVGRALRLDCAPKLKGGKLGKWKSLHTSPVCPFPKPAPSRRKLVNTANEKSSLVGQPFKCLNYNVLAQIYATRQVYPYAPMWALQWNYRKKLLLRDIVSHDADIICLQEVQATHYEEFFKPQLNQAGYDGIFKRKTREALGDDPGAIDGCATFYKRDRFILLEQFGIEYDQLARKHTTERKALRRLVKGNIALGAVLEDIGPLTISLSHRSRKRRICVTNTHIYWDPEYDEVKLWQVWALCKELEPFVLPRNLPLLICGDFNSLPDSSVYELLGAERVESHNMVFARDPCHILPSPSAIFHRLPLASAYSLFEEPKYTNYTGHFVGVLDYIWFSKSHLAVTTCLEVDDEELLKKDYALPSPQYPSDHIALVFEFDWIVDTKIHPQYDE